MQFGEDAALHYLRDIHRVAGVLELSHIDVGAESEGVELVTKCVLG